MSPYANRRYDRPALAVLVAACSLVGCASIGFSADRETSELPSVASGYAPGELLIKVKPEAAKAIQQARATGAVTATSLPSLDALLSRYGVVTIDPVFQGPLDAAAINEKFPERAKRAAGGTPPPDLTGYYKLTLKPDADIRDAVSAFGLDPNVELAQPNYTVTITQPSGSSTVGEPGGAGPQ